MEDPFHWHLSWIRRESGNIWHTVSMEEAPHVKKAAEKVGGRGQQTLVRLGQNLFSSWSLALYLLEDSLDATMSPTVSSRLKVIPTTFVFHVLQVPQVIQTEDRNQESQNATQGLYTLSVDFLVLDSALILQGPSLSWLRDIQTTHRNVPMCVHDLREQCKFTSSNM